MFREKPRPAASRPTRRAFLKRTGSVAAGTILAGLRDSRTSRLWAAPSKPSIRIRPDLLDDHSPREIELVQLTTEADVPASHIYMEAQIFTLDSQRFVLHRSATAHGGNKNDRKHQYLLCDPHHGCAMQPLTNELGVTGPSVSPDGKYFYYFVDETEVGGGRLSLKRVQLDGADRQTIAVVDKPLPGTKCRPSRIYPLSTMSSDGNRVAISAFLGDGNTANAPWGMMVFDIPKATVNLVIEGPSWCNMHPQYCRSLDPEASHDILIQENHGNVGSPRGEIQKLTGGEGADIHVLRDDGQNFRNMPWGRDGNEFCQGHQCWRGRSTWAITSTSARKPSEAQLIEGRAAAHAGHVGKATPGGTRNDLSRDFPSPHFYHFATDLAGQRLISDAAPFSSGGRIFLMELGQAGREPARKLRYLLNPKSSCNKTAHIHPFLSPDGSLGFFNSDESGILQAYMIRGLDKLTA